MALKMAGQKCHGLHDPSVCHAWHLVFSSVGSGQGNDCQCKREGDSGRFREHSLTGKSIAGSGQDRTRPSVPRASWIRHVLAASTGKWNTLYAPWRCGFDSHCSHFFRVNGSTGRALGTPADDTRAAVIGTIGRRGCGFESRLIHFHRRVPLFFRGH